VGIIVRSNSTNTMLVCVIKRQVAMLGITQRKKRIYQISIAAALIQILGVNCTLLDQCVSDSGNDVNCPLGKHSFNTNVVPDIDIRFMRLSGLRGGVHLLRRHRELVDISLIVPVWV
jgi:hypothetical protein